MMEASPAATFVMTGANLLLELEIVALNAPAHLGLIDHAFERDVVRQRREPVVVQFAGALRPLDQQPLFGRRRAPPGVLMGRTHPPSGEPRGQNGIAAIPPGDLLPGVGGEL
jgi:hypothetical protein